MGKPLTIQPMDDEQIERLRELTGLKTKIEVIRRGLRLLEDEVAREARVRRWKHAAAQVSESSRKINEEFSRNPKRFKDLP